MVRALRLDEAISMALIEEEHHKHKVDRCHSGRKPSFARLFTDTTDVIGGVRDICPSKTSQLGNPVRQF